jgi:hypothetical protein
VTEPGAQEGSGETTEPTFADVLNNLTLDSARNRRRRRREDPATEAQPEPAHDAPPETVDQASSVPADEPPAEQPVSLFGLTSEPPLGGGIEDDREPPDGGPAPDDGSEDEVAAVRPYAWTRGRTRPAHEFAVETLVSTSEHGHDVATLTSVEHRAVAELCRSPRSVAEVAAMLSLPLGVAKVLLGDMTDIGLVVVHAAASSSGDVPDRALMERVLSGLRRL